jgi:nucleoid DNA-binding protein
MAAKAIREHVLIPALREQGLSVLKARAAIDTVLDSIKDALGRHEWVELPIGSFEVLPTPKERGCGRRRVRVQKV